LRALSFLGFLGSATASLGLSFLGALSIGGFAPGLGFLIHELTDLHTIVLVEEGGSRVWFSGFGRGLGFLRERFVAGMGQTIFGLVVS
jgi:hypothetical protein